MRLETKFKLAAVSVLLIMVYVGAGPYRMNLSVQASQLKLKGSVDRQMQFERLIGVIGDAETGQRGFIITGKESFLKPYYSATAEMPALRKALDEEAVAGEAEKKAIADIIRLSDMKMAELAETVELRRKSGFAAAEQVVTSEQGRRYMDELRALIGQQIGLQIVRRIEMRNEVNRKMEKALYVGIVATVVDLTLLAGLIIAMFKVMKARLKTSALLRGTSDQLTQSMAVAAARNKEMETSAEMLHALASVSSLAETSRIINSYCAKLFPGLAGALYLYRNSRDMLEMQATWGSMQAVADYIHPSDCWSLRRGRAHHTHNEQDLCCGHYSHEGGVSIGRLCVPLVTQGEVIGLFVLEGLSEDPEERKAQNLLADRVAEQTALALSNVKLRETLHHQSIVDPLTGLFNRRYMDETLKRELARAERKGTSLSLIVLDLDHFKRVNDTYGHDGGDVLLRCVARILQDKVRGSDLACRLGGEELVLVLPECDVNLAVERAEIIRHAIADIKVQHGSHMLANATASFGVASFTMHGRDAATLFSAADKALYRAKHAGRNCVMVAS